MSTPLAFIYHDAFDGRGFSRLSDSWRRYRLARELFQRIGLLAPSKSRSPRDPSNSLSRWERAGVRVQAAEASNGNGGGALVRRHPNPSLASPGPFYQKGSILPEGEGTGRALPDGEGTGLPLVEVRPSEATDAEILRAHTPEHLEHVRAGDARGTGFLDYGDTPAWSGVLRRARLAVGGTLTAARLVASGRFRRAFNPAGGLHHARRDRAGGFCPFNDLVIAVRCLQDELGIRRIAIVDLDGHHGDGTEALLYDEPILTISLHRYDGRFYPATGAPGHVGAGAGFGYNLNVPLERGTDAGTYLRAFEWWVVPAVRGYQPEILFVVVGADSHIADPLVHLGLTLPAYRELASQLAGLADEWCAGRLVAVAGGGYSPEHCARCWAVFVGTLADAWATEDSRLRELFAEDNEQIPRSVTPDATRGSAVPAALRQHPPDEPG